MYINRKRMIERLMCSPLTLHLPKNYRDGIKDLLEKAPAVDAVEVVRCGECKHLTISQSDLDNRELYSCYHPHGLMKINKNCYCSYGERKDMA